MPFNFRLNLQSVFRRLGIQSAARLPQLNDNVQMTMQVTDLSRLVPAPIEARGLAGVNIAAPLGDFPVCQLQALSPGGIFIEFLLLRGSAASVTEGYVVNVDANNLGLAAANNINIGGTQIFSAFTAGVVAFLPPGGVVFPSPDGFTTYNLPLGIFVPNQALFTLAPRHSPARLDVAVIYRELPSVEEIG